MEGQRGMIDAGYVGKRGVRQEKGMNDMVVKSGQCSSHWHELNDHGVARTRSCSSKFVMCD